MSSLKRGFNEIVPAQFLDIFDEKELELVIGGLGEIDMDDWKKNTEYRGCMPSDTIVRWLLCDIVPLDILNYICWKNIYCSKNVKL